MRPHLRHSYGRACNGIYKSIKRSRGTCGSFFCDVSHWLLLWKATAYEGFRNTSNDSEASPIGRCIYIYIFFWKWFWARNSILLNISLLIDISGRKSYLKWCNQPNDRWKLPKLFFFKTSETIILRKRLLSKSDWYKIARCWSTHQITVIQFKVLRYSCKEWAIFMNSNRVMSKKLKSKILENG